MNKITHIIDILNQMYPNAQAELIYHNHFELLVCVVLSAQTTDISVNKVTPKLFGKYPTPKLLGEAEERDIENIIKSIGLYHNKAKNIKMLAHIVHEKYHDEVPDERTLLESLPGVGRKTANVVLSNAFGIPALAVDTHVARVSIRLGLAKKGDNVLVIEKKLTHIIPIEKWQKIHHQFIFFGRYHCLAKKPKCYQCPVIDLCQYEDKKLD